jgi:hypothetical protein
MENGLTKKTGSALKKKEIWNISFFFTPHP